MKAQSENGGIVVYHVELELPAPADVSKRVVPLAKRLLPYLPVVRSKLTARRLRRRGEEDYNDFHWRLEMLPYSLNATYDAYSRFAAGTRRVAESYGTNVTCPLTLPSTDVSEICFAIDSFLEAGRRTQDALITYVSAAIGQSLPSSFRKLMDGMAKHRSKLPAAIADIFSSYWAEQGNALRAYRVISQHYALVASDVTLFKDGRGNCGLHILLPSNGDVDKLGAPTWGTPPVHAQPFLRAQLKGIVGTAHFLTKLLARALPGEDTQLIGVYPRIPQKIGDRIDGYRPLTEVEIESDAQAAIDAIDERPLPALQL